MRTFVLSLIVGAAALIGATSAQAAGDKAEAAGGLKTAVCNTYRLTADAYLKHQAKLQAADKAHEAAGAKADVTTDAVALLRDLGDVTAEQKAAWEERLSKAVRIHNRANLKLSELHDRTDVLTELLKSNQRTVEAFNVTCPKMPNGYPVFTDEAQKPTGDSRQLSQATTDQG